MIGELGSIKWNRKSTSFWIFAKVSICCRTFVSLFHNVRLYVCLRTETRLDRSRAVHGHNLNIFRPSSRAYHVFDNMVDEHCLRDKEGFTVHRFVVVFHLVGDGVSDLEYINI